MDRKLPLQTLAALEPRLFSGVRERAIFECYKADPQVGDVDVLSPFPLLIAREDWKLLAGGAEKLAAETAAMEEELFSRPSLHKALGLPGPIRRMLQGCAGREPRTAGIRLIRFDFHYTTEGWKISEANTDVPGGFIEAAGFTRLMAEHYPGTMLTADPCILLADAIRGAAGEGATAALVHATAYADDGQVMMYLADRLTEAGIRTHLAAPDHLTWREGRAFMRSAWAEEAVDFIFRFFPSEWLCNLSSHSPWRRYFAGSLTPVCNPATAVLTQSKRLPLVWDSLRTPVPAWRAFLPETRDPRDCDWHENDDWVLKPALGRVGEDILIPGATDAKESKTIRKNAKRHPGHWAAQRRFSVMPVGTNGSRLYPCIGVYTINGKAAGAYGRISEKPLINAYARDVAILVKEEQP